MFTTWKEWLDGPVISFSDIAPLIVCGPHFDDCEFTRAGKCAVAMRGLSTLERWTNMRECGLCLGIENARAVDRLYHLMGLTPDQLATKGTTLTDFVRWARTKQSITIPSELNALVKEPLRAFKSGDGCQFPASWMISFEDVLKIWGVTPPDLYALIEKAELTPFMLRTQRQGSDGVVYYDVHSPWPVDWKAFLSSRIGFALEQIRELESKYPHLAMPPISDADGAEVAALRKHFADVVLPPSRPRKVSKAPPPIDPVGDYWRPAHPPKGRGEEISTSDIQAFASAALSQSREQKSNPPMAETSPDTPQQPVAPHTELATPELQAQLSAASTETPTKNSMENAIAKWEAVIPKLSKADKRVALLAIEKLKGKTHAEAYDAVFSAVIKNKIEAVSKRKARAERIVKRYKLPMPKWKTE